jgi:hypothetical protein
MAITALSSGSFLQASPGICPYCPRTLAAWIKTPPNATATNYVFYLTGFVATDAMNLHYAGVPVPNTFGSVGQDHNGSTLDGTVTVGGPWAPGWHFVVATHDDGGVAGNIKTISLFIDGVAAGGITTGSPVTGLLNNDSTSTDYIYSGNADGTATVAYPMAWKRLITQAEITALYNGGAGADPRVVAPNNLVLFSQLNKLSNLADLVTPTIIWNQTGTGLILVADPFSLTPPVVSNPSNPFPPPWEKGPGPADPAISAIGTVNYVGAGYGVVGTGEVGTINAGANTPVAPAGTPAQMRFFIGADGNLYAVGNQTTQTYLISGPVANPPPLIPIYSPTK